jgi:hypothetical protein
VTGGARISGSGTLAPGVSWESGIDAEVDASDWSRVGSLTLPPREGDIAVFGQPPPADLSADAWKTTHVGIAPWVTGRFAWLDERLRASAGLRFDPYVVSVSRVTPREGTTPAIGAYVDSPFLEPRLSLEATLVPGIDLRAAAGRYAQPASGADLSPVFGNPFLGTSEATHLLAGTRLELDPSLSAELTWFRRDTSRLPVRNPAETPERGRALVPAGEGRAVGGQALLKLAVDDLVSGWISYTLQRSERRASSSDPWRRFDLDETHVFTAVASWTLATGWELGSRLRLASGKPRTAVTGAYLDATRDTFQPLFGEHQGDALPGFAQWDLRLAHALRTDHGTWDLWFEVQNVTNRQNAEEFVYSADYTRRGIIAGLPLFPMVGLRWSR